MRPERHDALSFWRAATAIALAGFVLLVTLFSTCPSLHHRLHADDENSDSCAVCLFVQGQVNFTDVAPSLVTLVFCLVFLLPLAKAIAASAQDCRLLPSRAPPARRSSHSG